MYEFAPSIYIYVYVKTASLRAGQHGEMIESGGSESLYAHFTE